MRHERTRCLWSCPSRGHLISGEAAAGEPDVPRSILQAGCTSQLQCLQARLLVFNRHMQMCHCSWSKSQAKRGVRRWRNCRNLLAPRRPRRSRSRVKSGSAEEYQADCARAACTRLPLAPRYRQKMNLRKPGQGPGFQSPPSGRPGLGCPAMILAGAHSIPAMSNMQMPSCRQKPVLCVAEKRKVD